jgi:dephospho-CoA kinase
MQILGIIGGIGSGKSTASALFRQCGAAVIDADVIGHQTLLLFQVKESARQRWGSVVFGADGEIDRRTLATIVFADEKELAYLKSLTHPLIAEEVHRQREHHERNGVEICLLDAPLLLESGWESLVDQIIFISAPAAVRWERIQNRGWPETEWRQREAAQFSAAEKERRANVVLDNSGSTEHLQTQVENFFATLRLPQPLRR